MDSLLEKIGLTFGNFITLLVIVILGVVAIRISIQFDINEWLKGKKAANLTKLRNACPHVSVSNTDDGNSAWQSLFISPPGTMQWQCQQCGMTKYMQDDEIENMIKTYANDHKQFVEDSNRFHKLLKKNRLV